MNLIANVLALQLEDGQTLLQVELSWFYVRFKAPQAFKTVAIGTIYSQRNLSLIWYSFFLQTTWTFSTVCRHVQTVLTNTNCFSVTVFFSLPAMCTNKLHFERQADRIHGEIKFCTGNLLLFEQDVLGIYIVLMIPVIIFTLTICFLIMIFFSILRI